MPWILLLGLGLVIAGPAGALAFGLAGLAALAAVVLGGLAVWMLHVAEAGTEASVWAGAIYWIAKGPALLAVVCGIPWAAAPGPAAFTPYPGEPAWLSATEGWLYGGAGWQAAHRLRAAALGFWHLGGLHVPALAQWALGAGALATGAVAGAAAFALGVAALGALERAVQSALWGRWPWQPLPPAVAWLRRTRRAAWLAAVRRAHPGWERPAPRPALTALAAARDPAPGAASEPAPGPDASGTVIRFPGPRRGRR